MDKIGVIILNYITWQQTEQCIRSVKKSVCKDKIVIYVVDNCSPDTRDIEKLCRENEVVYIQNPQNVGYAAGNNVGIKRALEDGCSYLLISNNDMIYQEDCILNMKDFLRDNAEYGIVGPKLYDKQKQVQKCHLLKQPQYNYIWRTQTILRYICKRAVEKLYGDDDFYNKTRDVYAVSGCSFMMTAECASQVTPLDENTFLYEEESILGYRMKQEGIKTAYNPNCKALHNHDQTTRLVKPFALICWACSEIYYCREYLNVSKLKIRILHIYRYLIFLLHGIKDKVYRSMKHEFRNKTKKYLGRSYSLR